MTDRKTTLDVISNVVFIVACVALTAYVGVRAWRTWEPAAAVNAPEAVPVGSVVPAFDGFQYSSARKTVVVVVSSQCHFCTESMAFYRRLAEEHKSPEIKLAFASLEPKETTHSYLSRHAVKPDAVLQLFPTDISLPGTPTLIVVDAKGVVLSSRVGRLNPKQEAQLLDELKG